MKRLLVVLGIAVVLFGSCQKNESGGTVAPDSAGKKNKLIVWSAVEDFETMINTYYKPSHPNVEIEYTYVPPATMDEKLGAVLSSGQGVPDVFSTEADYVRKYVESGLLLDITDVYNGVSDKVYQYVADVGSDNGKVYGLAWQTTPGVIYYRRSLAKKYIGTDNPATVQTFFANPKKFLETAALIKLKSNNTCYVMGNGSELLWAFANNRQQPWIVNNQLVIDPLMLDYMDTVKQIRDRGYDCKVNNWTDSWYASMNGNLQDENGKPIDIFGVFLPAWGLFYVLMPGASETSGDWGIIPGPYTHFRGGTWLHAWNKTQNPETAKEFIRYFTTDDTLLEQWISHTYDMVSNSRIVEKLKTSNLEVPFLSGQNPYVIYADLASHVTGKLFQRTDGAINALFDENVTAFVNGEKTKDQAITDFTEQVNTQLGY
jgi:ABC-type glycerol-3-phosphate transport system substrate-binding protein